MEFVTDIIDYFKSFVIEPEYTYIHSRFITSKPKFFQYNTLDSIDFDKTSTEDIVNMLNKWKYEYKFESSYYENMNDMNCSDKLLKLKHSIILCLESNNDTTHIMIKHIRKYKGEIAPSVDKSIEVLEKRFIELKNYIKNDNHEDDDDNDNHDDGKIGVLIRKKVVN